MMRWIPAFILLTAGCLTPDAKLPDEVGNTQLGPGQGLELGKGELVEHASLVVIRAETDAVIETRFSYFLNYRAGVEATLDHACILVARNGSNELPLLFLAGDAGGTSAHRDRWLIGPDSPATRIRPLASIQSGQPAFFDSMDAGQSLTWLVGYKADTTSQDDAALTARFQVDQGHVSVQVIPGPALQCLSWPHEFTEGDTLAAGDTYQATDAGLSIGTQQGLALFFDLRGTSFDFSVSAPDGTTALREFQPESMLGETVVRQGWHCSQQPGDWQLQLPVFKGNQGAGTWTRIVAIDTNATWHSHLPCA